MIFCASWEIKWDGLRFLESPSSNNGPIAPTANVPPAPTFAAETASVVTPRATFRFSNAGGSLIGAEMADYRVLPARNRPVDLARRGAALVTYKIIVERDTVDLSRLPLHGDAGAQTVRYEGTTPLGTISLNYTFAPDSYLVRVSGTLKGAGTAPARLGVMLPQGLSSYEADTLDDHTNLAFVVKRVPDDAESVKFSKLAKSGLAAMEGPFSWVASKNKYFLIAVLAPSKGSFSGPAIFTASMTQGKVPSVADGEVILSPDADGRFAFEIYAGPQQWRRQSTR